MAEHSELARALAALDAYANGADLYCQVAAEGARLLRELAQDFAVHAVEHDEFCKHARKAAPRVCSCGLDAARARWRLLP